MRLSIISHRQSVRFEALVQYLAPSRLLKNFSYMGVWRYSQDITDLYVSSTTMQMARRDRIPEKMFGYRRAFLELGISPTSIDAALMVSSAFMKNDENIRLGVMQMQPTLLKSAAGYRELFAEENHFMVSVIGNGMVSLRTEFLRLREVYPDAVPCVMFLSEKDQAELPAILSEFWNEFSELIFWSESTLFGVDIEALVNDIRPLRQRDDMRYIALQPTTIREGMSLSARGLGRTETGKLYFIKEVYPDTNFARLEDGSYVVFTPEYFEKETYTI